TPLTLLPLNCPFALPPARTCAFSTRSFVFRFLARMAASSDVFATQKGGVGMPASLNKLNRSLRVRPVTPKFPDRLYITSLKVRSSTSPLESDAVVLCVRERDLDLERCCAFCLNGDRLLGGLVIVVSNCRFCATVNGGWRVVVENARHLISVRRFLPHEHALTKAPSCRSINRSAPHGEEYPVIVPLMYLNVRFMQHPPGDTMCKKKTSSIRTLHAVRKHAVISRSNVGSSGFTGKIVRLLGLWRLTKRHVHFSVNL
ncbi:hypothetical protein ALC57_14124, partial [Trachymyrmex cornetzi]